MRVPSGVPQDPAQGLQVDIMMPPGLVDFMGSLIIKHKNSRVCLYAEHTSLRQFMATSDRYILIPFPGRHWRRRFYSMLCWTLGRRGRNRYE